MEDDVLHEAPTEPDGAFRIVGIPRAADLVGPDDAGWAWAPEPMRSVWDEPDPTFVESADDPTEPVPVVQSGTRGAGRPSRPRRRVGRHRAAVLSAAGAVAVVVIGSAAVLVPGAGPDTASSGNANRARAAAPTTAPSTPTTAAPTTTTAPLPPTTVVASRQASPTTQPTAPPTTPPTPTTAPGSLLDLLPIG